MGDPNKPENIKNEEGFDIKKSLDNKKFLDFLTEHPDYRAFNMTDSNEMQKKYETFETSIRVADKYQKIFGEKVKEEIGFKLSPEDLEIVGIEINKMAQTDPEGLITLEKTIEDFEKLPREIVNLQNQINEKVRIEKGTSADLVKLKEDLVFDRSSVDLAKETVGLRGLLRRFSEPFLDVDGKSKNLDQEISKDIIKVRYAETKFNKAGLNLLAQDIDSRIADLGSRIDDVKKLEGLRSESLKVYLEQRSKLFEHMRGLKGSAELIKTKVQEQMDQVLAVQTSSGLEKAQTSLERISKANSEGEITQGSVKESGIEKDQVKINQGLERLISEEISLNVNGLNIGNGAYSRLEKGLKSILELEKLGSNNREDARQFVIDTLKATAKSLDLNKSDNRAKELMLRHIISTLQK